MLLRKTGILLGLLLYLMLETVGELVCPERIPCKCWSRSVYIGDVEYQHRVVDCSRKGLTSVPNLLPLSGRFYHQLLLNGNRIENVPQHIFASLSIRSIDLSDNPLLSVSDGAFEYVAGLKEVLFRNCSLRTAPIALRYAKGLTHLDLSYNKIYRLVPYAIGNLHMLEDLDISGNLIQFPWPFYAFERMRRLKRLRIADNGLINLPKPALEQVPHLQYLDLSNNNIKGWNPQDLDLVPKLKELDLRRNPLEFEDSARIFGFLIRLRSLQLSHCNIPYLESALFPKDNNITRLTVSWCNITSIQIGLFHRFSNLKYLDISGNPLFIREKYFRGLEDTLEVLHINHMHLGSLSFTHLTNFNRLRHMYANHNDLYNLLPGTLRGVLKPNLHLHLNYNNITMIHTYAFDVLYFPVRLSLQGNNLSDLGFLIRQPCRFIGLNLDVRNNPINCDCDLFRLEDMKIVNVTGKCANSGPYRGKRLSWRPGIPNRDDYFLQNASDRCLITTHFAQRFECTCGDWVRHDDPKRCSDVILGLSSGNRLISCNVYLLGFILCIMYFVN